MRSEKSAEAIVGSRRSNQPYGDMLTAEYNKQTIAGRHGIYDIKVTNGSGDVVALYRGKSTQLKGQIVAP